MPRPDLSLSTSEEITLRRVAHGQSDVGRLPPGDVAPLRWLMLVNGHADRPKLTLERRQRFEAFTKPVALRPLDVEGTLTRLVNA